MQRHIKALTHQVLYCYAYFSCFIYAFVVLGLIIRLCEECAEPFSAGIKACDDSGQVHIRSRCSTCEHNESKIQRCPNCGMKFFRSGGCMLMRCCILGFHGCPRDHYEPCEYCDHPEKNKGCGYVFQTDR